MAYRPTNVRALRDAASRAVDVLDTMRNADTAASGPMSAIASARSIVESWLPFLDGMVTCRAMEGFVPVHLDGSDVRLASLVAMQRDGWTLSTDIGSPAPAAMTGADARALGELLANGDARDLLDSKEELDWLTAQLLAIAGDEELQAEFESELAPGSTRWAEVCDELSVVRLNLDPDDDRRVVDQVFAAVAQLDVDCSWDGPLIAAMEPYSAALLLTFADMTPNELGRSAYVALRGAWELGDAGVLLDDGATERAGDILFSHLVTIPAAATQFLLETSWAHPPIPFHVAYDQELVRDLLVVGTSPDLIDASTAGKIIVPIMQWFLVNGDDRGHVGPGLTAHDLAATLAVPWLMQFETYSAEWTNGDEAGWGWEHAGQGHEALQMILDEGAAYGVLAQQFASFQSAVRDLEGLFENGTLEPRQVLDVADTLWRVLLLLREQEIDWGDDIRFPFDVVMQAAELYVGTLNLPAKVAASVGIGTPAVVDLLEHWKLVPPDRDEVRDIADSTLAQRSIEMTGTILAVVLLQLEARGLVEREDIESFTFTDTGGDCAPTEALAQLRDFVEGLDVDPGVRDDVLNAVTAFMGPGTALLLCEM